MAEFVNPYIAGAPVSEASMFFGREDVFDWIENSLAGRYADHILVIHGQRRVGKTSVLKQLGNRLPGKYLPVFFDLQGRTHTSLDRFLWWLAREIVRVLKQASGVDIPLAEYQDFASDPDFFEHHFLPELRPQLGDRTLLLTFDEFDSLEEEEVKQGLAGPLIDHLRRMMGTPGLTFIFSIGSSGRKLENMRDTYTEFFKTALYKKISFLNEEQIRALVTRPSEGVLEFEPAAVRRIFTVAGGHPYFTQLTCHELFARCQRTKDRDISEADVDSVLDDVIERGTVNLKFVWDEASDIEKWALAGLARLEKTEGHALADFLRQQHVRFSENELTSGLLHLREKDVLNKENRFVIHLLRLWLQKNRPLEQAREELTEVNPIANRYIEIGLEFKDAGAHEKAIASFREALAVAPGNLQAQVSIGLTHMDAKQYPLAISEFEKALAVDDEDVAGRAGLCEAYLAVGNAALERGRTREAVQSFERVLEINGEHAEARARLSDVARRRAEKAISEGKDEDALAAFAEALKFTPDDATLVQRVDQVRAEKRARVLAAQFARADREANAGNWDRALEALNDALQIAPDEQAVHERVASLRDRQLQDRLTGLLMQADGSERASRWDVAIGALGEYLSLKEDERVRERLTGLVEAKREAWFKAVISRADQALQAQKWDEALAALNEVLSLEPGNAEFQRRAGEVRKAEAAARLAGYLRTAARAEQASKWDEAVEALNQAASLDPADKTTQESLERVLAARRAARLRASMRLVETAIAAGKWDVAVESLKAHLSNDPANVEIQKKLTEVQSRQREAQLANLKSRAGSLRRSERFEEAIAAWQEYIALEPGDADKAAAEITVLQKAQATARSYREAQRALAHKQFDAAIALLKGIILEDAEYKDASALLAQAIELRRKARPWWQNKWLWTGVGAAVVVAGTWFALRPGSPLLTPPAPPAALPEASAAPVAAPVLPTSTAAGPTPTAIPLAWTRVNSLQMLPRDMVTTIVFHPTDPGIIYAGTANSGVYKSLDGGLSWQPILNGLGRAGIGSLAIDPQAPDVIYAGAFQTGVYRTRDGGGTWQHIAGEIGSGFPDLSLVLLDPSDHLHLIHTTGNKGILESRDGGDTWRTVEAECPNGIMAMAFHPTDGTVFASQWIDEGPCTTGIYQVDTGDATSELYVDVELTHLSGLLAVEEAGGALDLFISRYEDPFVVTDAGGTRLPLPGLAISTSHPSGGVVALRDGVLTRTTDGGQTWTELGVPPSDQQGTSIAVSPMDPNLILVGGAGLAISRDGGATWQQSNSGMPAVQVDLSAPAASAARLFMNAVMEDYSWDSPLHESTDGGRTWDLVSDQGEGLSITHDGSNLFRLSREGGGVGIRLSGGTGNWRQSDFLLEAIGQQARKLVVDPSDPNVMLVLTDLAPYLYRSADGGATWTETRGLSTDPGLMSPGLFVPSDQDSLMYAAGAINVVRSDDQGQTWSECEYRDLWLGTSDQSRLAISPEDANVLYLGTRGSGVHVSANGCRSWTPQNAGLSSLFVNSVVIDPAAPGTIYAGTEGGAYVSTDGGENWGPINEGLLGATVIHALAIDAEGSVYAASPYGIFLLEGDG